LSAIPIGVSLASVEDLHNGTVVEMSCPQHVIQCGQDYNTNRSNNAVVHCLDSDRGRNWPKAEKDGNGHVDKGVRIDNDAENARQVEWSPDESDADGVDNRLLSGVGKEDAACAPPVEKERDS